MTDTIVAYICKKTLGLDIAEVNIGAERAVTSQVDNDIITKLMPDILPEGCRDPVDGEFRCWLEPDNMGNAFAVCTPECWYYDNPDIGFIDWTRGITVGEDEEILTHPVVTYRHPDHCQWIETQLLVFGPSRISEINGEVLAFTFPDAAPGEIPGNSKSDQFTGGGLTNYTITQNVVVPGMELRTRHLFANGENTTRIEADFATFCTCCLSGGKIISVIGSGEYRVLVNRVSQKAFSSDRIAYAVNDWVFLSPMAISPNCSDPDRNEPCYNACPTGDEAPNIRTYVILPLKIGQDGA